MNEATKITDRNFFLKSADKLAPELLGKIICHRLDDKNVLRFRITETEAYCQGDSACHAVKYEKNTKGYITQNKIGGILYVHPRATWNCFDIVANEEGIGEGVLIRGGVNIDEPTEIYPSDPGKLGNALKIKNDMNGKVDFITSKEMWIEDDGYFPKYRITTRDLGNSEADNDTINREWRFISE